MTTIYKFPIKVIDSQDVLMPFGVDILAVAWQGEHLCLWAKCESENSHAPVRILIYGTGHVIKENNLRHIGTVQQFGGKLIWHVFEKL